MNLPRLFIISLAAYIGANTLTVAVTYARGLQQSNEARSHSILNFKPATYDPDITAALRFTDSSVNDTVNTQSKNRTSKQSFDTETAINPLNIPKNPTLQTETPQILGSFITIGPPLDEEPVDINGTIIIPAINVNSPIAFNVRVSEKKYYQEALERGVAHAKGTGVPSKEGSNTYLFAHSTQFEEYIARYAAVFTKLHQLNIGDPIIIFYNGKRYDYEVVEEEIVPSFDVSVLTREHEYTALTLQTCSPPGIPKDRLITTAKLIAVYDK